ncbi:MAG TPA: 4-hydroxythreonine-4-phosphate dehydrogenase PdxA [Gammaproteobacteria bacterium]|nr:4-hydroxythreonine-4-phosphate dehydrogenase PdxA [Gammaproteobacteria bacterium]
MTGKPRPELPFIVVSSGEPAGIGPDICLALAARPFAARVAVLGDPALLAARAHALGKHVALIERARPAEVGPHTEGSLQLLAVAARASVTPGRLDTANSAYVLEILRRGAKLCRGGEAQALVTAPVQKSVISQAGFKFSGHTELLAELTGAPLPVMLLAGKTLRVALATTHLPLRAVPDALDAASLEQLIRIAHDDLQRLFKIRRPRVLVLGLNPHAGESGTLGSEERTIIEPVVRTLAAQGLAVTGPVSADTAFTPDSLATCDVVVAMYHDQGLAPLKALSFGEIVNVTLGLPIVRTSVDHGTALALAGTGRARADSLAAAVDLALELVRA